MTAPPAPLVARRRLSLRALITALAARAASPEAGQLDVYRVFLQVDARLLERSGITTLRFSEEREVRDPELQHAIAGAVEQVLGIAVPSQAWLEE